MKRTISIKLQPDSEQANALKSLQKAIAEACNLVVPFARDDRCWNQVALHHKAYSFVKNKTMIGSQMICIAIKPVASTYKILKIKKGQEVPTLFFKDSGRVHLDKRQNLFDWWFCRYSFQASFYLFFLWSACAQRLKCESKYCTLG